MNQKSRMYKLWIFEGDFKVLPEMVLEGKLIKNQIPNKVKGYFDCSDVQLTSLEGCPNLIGKSFYCENNKLKTLKGSPKEVGGYFYCHSNKLTSLEGCPKIFHGTFDCSNNELTSLEGSPLKIINELYCHHNLNNFSIEREFILSKSYKSKETYWIDLLRYMIDEKIDLGEVKGWPEGVLNKDLRKSISGISKYNL